MDYDDFIMELRSEIGHTLDLIKEEQNGSKRMKLQRYLSNIINCEDKCEVILNPGIYNVDSNPKELPIPFEKEMGMDENLAQYWLGWLQIIFNRRYKKEMNV